MGVVSRPQFIPVTTRQVRSGYRVFLRRRLQHHRHLWRPLSRRARRLQLRLCQRRRLIHKFSVAGPSLITPSGMSYRILALDPRSKQMSLPVLKKINELVEAGAIVVGAKPENTPSLADNQAEFHSLADKLWGAGIGASTGNGKVYGSQKLADVLETLNIGRDFEYEKSTPDTDILFVHRKLADGDLYFVDNRNDRDEAFDAAFRVQ